MPKYNHGTVMPVVASTCFKQLCWLYGMLHTFQGLGPGGHCSPRHRVPHDSNNEGLNRPISVYRLGEMPIQSCGQSVSAPRGKAGARLNAHTELRTKRQRSAPKAVYRYRPVTSGDVTSDIWQAAPGAGGVLELLGLVRALVILGREPAAHPHAGACTRSLRSST